MCVVQRMLKGGDGVLFVGHLEPWIETKKSRNDWEGQIAAQGVPYLGSEYRCESQDCVPDVVMTARCFGYEPFHLDQISLVPPGGPLWPRRLSHDGWVPWTRPVHSSVRFHNDGSNRIQSLDGSEECERPDDPLLPALVATFLRCAVNRLKVDDGVGFDFENVSRKR